jgi:NAD(P)-dependent dehydrogenase (short-subunit alcohol dehydrogenase family)
MSRRFEDKVVVVTGAAAGLGRARALGYAGEGAPPSNPRCRAQGAGGNLRSGARARRHLHDL